MSFEVSALVDIAIILILAKIFGEAAERLRFPSIFGQLIAGLAAGALFIVRPTQFMDELAGIGVLFLFFMLGVNMKVSDLVKEFRSSFLVTIGGTFTSFFIGFIFGYVMFSSALIGLFIGIAVMSTSTQVALKILHEAGELNTKLFNLASAASRIDDIIAVVMITLLTSVIATGPQPLLVVLSMIIVVSVFLLLETRIASDIGKWLEVLSGLKDENILIAVCIVAIFIVSFAVGAVGIGSAIGSFLAGFAFSKSKFTETDIIPKMSTIGYGFFIPVFFTYAAVSADAGMIYGSAAAVIALLVLASGAKFAGTAIFAWWEGHRGKELGLLGISMIPRGEFAVAISFIALTARFIDIQVYSIVIGFVALTMIATPLMTRIFRQRGY